jgi:Ni/Fe-hydrogenase 1 B-type cytochrome subunit
MIFSITINRFLAMTQTHSSSVSTSSVFMQEHSLMIRIWHWITFLLVSTAIITVLLNSTLMNQRKNILVVQEQLKSKGIIVTEDQAFAVTRQYEDKVWGVHKWVGYGLAFLLFSRIFIELTLPGEEKLRSRIKSALGLFKKSDKDKRDYQHYLRVKTGYLVFYLLLLCMALTGLSLVFGRELGFSRELRGTIKEIHSFGQYLVYSFAFLHICGVVIADNKKTKGLVSGMINGNK